MPTVMAYHDVDDVEHWLASNKREEFFGPLGVTNVRTFVDPQGSNRVGLVMEISDMTRRSRSSHGFTTVFVAAPRGSTRGRATGGSFAGSTTAPKSVAGPAS